MGTESASGRFVDLDAWSSLDALGALYEGQLAAVAAVGPALPAIAAAAEAASACLRRGGRLFYAGAGTSGRLGLQDGAELSPTFSWPSERVGFAIAGGDAAILQAVENAEDSADDGAARMAQAGIDRDDVVVGLSASGTTPFTLAALDAARQRGATTVGVANNPGTPILAACAFPILVQTGPEVLAGSTRMKAGTAQKVVLNLLSTLVMLRLGRVYRGEMVEMRATNEKLRRRSAAMVERLTRCAPEAAERALGAAEGDIRLAVLIASGATRPQAERALARGGGNLREALALVGDPR